MTLYRITCDFSKKEFEILKIICANNFDLVTACKIINIRGKISFRLDKLYIALLKDEIKQQISAYLLKKYVSKNLFSYSKIDDKNFNITKNIYLKLVNPQITWISSSETIQTIHSFIKK